MGFGVCMDAVSGLSPFPYLHRQNSTSSEKPLRNKTGQIHQVGESPGGSGITQRVNTTSCFSLSCYEICRVTNSCFDWK